MFVPMALFYDLHGIFLHLFHQFLDNLGGLCNNKLFKRFRTFLVLFTTGSPRAYLSGQTVNCICSSCDQMGNFQLWECISGNLDPFILLSCK